MAVQSEKLVRVGAVILLRADGAALLQLRDDKPGLRNAAMWVPPGGHAEPGESMEVCARREFREETDYDCAQLFWLCEFEDTVPGWPPYRLTVFWARYDGRQRYACHEGQALEFVPRDDLALDHSPPYMADLWDQAWRKYLENEKMSK